jgi:hypothetical protein
MRGASSIVKRRFGPALLGLGACVAAASAAHAQTAAPPAAEPAPPAQLQTLIGAPVAAADAGAVVVRLGPADADWSDDGQPLELRPTQWRGPDGRILWSRRRASDTGVSAASAIRPAATDDLSCLTQAVYYEARSQSLAGQQGVAQVVMNRTRVPGYGSSVCGVVYQRTPRTCQFSFVCDGSMDRRVEPAAWQRAQDVAARSLGGYVYDPLRDATHFHATYVSPAWSFTREEVMRIGAHIFYR